MNKRLDMDGNELKVGDRVLFATKKQNNFKRHNN